MTKRTISWLLSLMMIVSLFAGTLTSASAANNISIDPPSAVIYQTGSAAFTVSTLLDSLLDRIGSDKGFDLNDLVKSLKDEGLNVNTLTDMLTDAGFDWNSIVGSLTGSGFDPNDVLDAILDTLEGEAGVNWNDLIGSLTDNGFSMDQISGALLDRLEGGNIDLGELIGSLTGNEGTLTDLLNALKDKGFNMDSIWDLIGGGSGGNSGGSIGDLIGDLIGHFGWHSVGAVALSVSDEPEEDNGGVTTVIASNLKDKLREKYGDLFTENKEQELDDLFARIDAVTGPDGTLSLSDAVSALAATDHFDLNKTVDVIMSATDGEADYSTLVDALKDSTGYDLSMDNVADAFSGALGDDVDWGNLASALKDNLGDHFDVDDFLNAIGAEDTDLSGVAGKISEALGMEEGAIDADAVKDAITSAFSGEDGFDWDAFTSAMGEGFDSDAFLQSVAEKLGGEDTTIDAAAVSDAIQKALGEQGEPVDYTELANALKDAMGEDFSVDKIAQALTDAMGENLNVDSLAEALKSVMGEDFSVEKLTEALANALKGEDGEAPALDDIVSAVTDVMGGELTTDQITDLVQGLKDSLGENLSISELTGALADTISGDIEVSQLLSSLKEALGEDFDLNLDEIVSGLLGNGADLGEVVSALKDMDFSTGTITDILFGGELTYQWWSHVGRDKKPISSDLDSNVYSGADSRTLTVTRTTTPVQDEVYHYYCVVKIGDKDEKYESPEAELTIKADSAPVETTPPVETDPPVNPTRPVLNNVTHTAYIGGYEDGTVHPNSNITRAEVATIIYRLLTEESRTFYYTKVNVFSDVPGFEWFNEPISTLARASVLTGYEDGTFLPNAPITRAELATILTRLSVLEKTESDVTPVAFKDLAGHWAAANIRTAAANGWVNGYEGGVFLPDQYVTRAEAVTMVNRMLGRNPSVLTITTGMVTFSDNDPAEWYYIQIQEAANGHDYVRGDDGHEMWIRIKNN